MTRAELTPGSLRKVLIIGGYGTFGGRVARLLADDTRLTLVIAGRTLHKAESFIARYQDQAMMIPARFDRDADVLQQISDLAPDIVVDASGPFQDYGDNIYRVVEAAISAGVHYLDLADASEFVYGIEEFDSRAREKNLFVLSGASTCPSLSSAVCRRLARGMSKVHSIRGGVAPSPYSGVGLSVMRAVAHSAGKPVSIIRNDVVATAYPFTDAHRFTIAPPGYLPLYQRTFALVDLPDLRLLKRVVPQTENTWLGAAPVPAIYHATLRVLARLVKIGLLNSISSLAPLMAFVMNRLAWGEHRGGMFVEIRGEDNACNPVCRSWHLVAEGADGPSIPSMASAGIIRNYLNGHMPVPGARPAFEDHELQDFEYFFAQMNIHTGERNSPARRDGPVFQRALDSAWHELPEEIRQLHKLEETLEFNGRASVTRGNSLIAKLINHVVGFPPAGCDTPLRVSMKNKNGREYWTRDFDGQKFSSVMSSGKGRFTHLVREKFGPVSFAMALLLENGRLDYVHRGWTFLGIPMPRFLGPRGKTYEYVEDGKFHFHVDINLPIAGHVVTYDGWLQPANAS